ncbi:MAG: zinc ribbon domain-containing protein [Desulfobulbaceae bacterium]|nr:zinc ribbon domain-containing protein [Desulfobulbaceae bacterium]
MPIYEYECQKCKKAVEVMQSMSDKPLTSCPDCSGEMKKLVSSSSFQLKGGGWYADGYSNCGSASASSSGSSGGGCSAPSGGG